MNCKDFFKQFCIECAGLAYKMGWGDKKFVSKKDCACSCHIQPLKEEK